MAYHISFVERSIVLNLKESIIGIVSSPLPLLSEEGRGKTLLAGENQTYIKEKKRKHPNSKILCLLFSSLFFKICISCMIHAIYSTKMVCK